MLTLRMHWSVQVAINGVVLRTFASSLQPLLTFNGLGVKESEVRTVTLRHTDTGNQEWVDILEVSRNH